MRLSGTGGRHVRRLLMLLPAVTVGAYLLMFNRACAAQLPEGDFSSAARSTQSSHVEPGDSSDVEIPFSLRPYRISLSVLTTASVESRRFRRAGVLNEIRQAVSRMYGRVWDLNLDSADWLRPGTPRQISELGIDDLIQGEDPGELLDRYPESDYDKAIFLGVAATTAGFDMVCREYDSRTHELSSVVRGFTPDRRYIASVAVRLVRDSFRPCLTYVRRYVDSADREFIQLQVQAGEIPVPDPTAEQIREGDVLRLFHRFMKRTDSTQLRQLRPLPLNYVRVTSVDVTVTRGLVTGVLLTHGVVSPFGLRGRNLQQIALRQRPTARSSRIRLVERSVDNKPLICQRLNVVYKLRRKDADELEQVRLVSDRNGEVTVDAHDDFQTLWLYVYSGEMLLAWIPYAPGLVSVDTIELPDDSIRLSVEGDLRLFRDELVDSIALREVQFNMAGRAADEGNVEDFQQLLEEYGSNPTLDDFKDSLSLIRVRAVKRAEQQNNSIAKRAVERMCNRILDTLELFFSDEKRLKRRKEIGRLRIKVGINGGV